MLPGRAAGRVKQRRRRHQIADAPAQARVPRGLHGHAIGGVSRESECGRGRETRKLHGLIAEADVALDADDPSRRDLPVVAGIGIGPESSAAEGLGDGSAGQIKGRAVEQA